jgi:hypothetical protein
VLKLKHISIVALAALALMVSSGAVAQDQRDGRWGKHDGNQARQHLNGPGPHRGEWLRNHQNQPLPDQERALRNDPYFRQLPPDRQQQLINRLRDFNNRSPEQRQRMLERMETFEHLPQPERQQLRSYYGQMRELPDNRRTAVRDAVRQLSGMNSADRERVLNSRDFQRRFSPEEQNLIRGLMQYGPR